MSFFSFHLVKVPLHTAVGAFLRPPRAPGLEQIEVLAGMQLGAAVLSPRRMQIRRIAVFAKWEDESALNDGWHVRLEFLRRWGEVRELAGLEDSLLPVQPDEPVVAVTLARMRLLQLPRFIYWGRPVERQVRDHPETTLAMAAI